MNAARKRELTVVAICVVSLCAIGFHLPVRWQLNQANIVLKQGLLLGKKDGRVPAGQISQLQQARMLLERLGRGRWVDCMSSLQRNQAKTNLELQDYPATVAILERRVNACKDDLLAWFWLGRAYNLIQDRERAIDAWRSAGAVVPLQTLGDQLTRQGMWAEGAKAYLAALALQPANCIYRVRAGNALWWSARNLAAAMAQFEQAVVLCPEAVEAYVGAGRILLEAKEYAEAERWATLGRTVDPLSEAPLNVLALSKLRQGRVWEAMEFLHKALSLNPKSAEVHALLGSAYVGLGELEQSIQELNEAIRLGPAQAWHYETLGLVYEKRGDYAGAVIAYSKALELNPASQAAQEHLLRLQERK